MYIILKEKDFVYKWKIEVYNDMEKELYEMSSQDYVYKWKI